MENQYSENEFIKLNRKILKWEWFSDTCTRDVFIYCLLKANWKAGSWHGIEYNRGEFITSLPSISEDLGFSIKNVRTALKHLKQTGEVADRTYTKYRIISINNYDKYQGSGRQNGRQGADKGQTSGRQGADKGQTSGRQGAADKEDKNNKESKKEKESAAPLPPWAAAKGWSLEEYERWRNQ